MALTTTDFVEPTLLERGAALNGRLCGIEIKLGLELMPSLSLSERVERLVKLAQHQRISSKDYGLLVWLRAKLAEYAAKDRPMPVP
jgi:hypothetical protein